MSVDVTFRIFPEDDGTAELYLGFVSERAAGSGTAYFLLDALLDFARALGEYPLDPRALPVLSGGYWDPTEQHVGVSITPKNSRGHLLLDLRVATPSDDQGVGHPAASATIRVTIDYSQLALLSKRLQVLASGRGSEFSMTFT